MDSMPTLLLTTVFKPFGVMNKFNAKDDDLLLDLMAARLTREPSVFSLSGTFSRSALHLLASNIKKSVKVVEYPTIEQFIEEIKKGYEYIGITFVIKEVIKVAHMITLIKEHSPKTKIIVGGFGTMIPNIKQLGPDYICKGEGIYFLREIFKEEMDRGVTHPYVTADFSLKIFNKYPLIKKHKVGLIVSGFGCPNRCNYCCTSAFYGKKHVDFIKSPGDFMKIVREFQLINPNIKNFIIWEEDFFLYKDKVAVLQKLARDNIDSPSSFACFGSVSSITNAGLSAVDLVEMGVSHIWIGVESKHTDLAKRKGMDIKKLFHDLHSSGITTTASMIFGLDCQNRDNLKDDIDYFISLHPTTNQLSTIMATPGTAIYQIMDNKNRLLKKDWLKADLYQESIKHADFEEGELSKEVFKALERIYGELGPSLLRALEVYFNGYRMFNNSHNIFLKKRAEIYATSIKTIIPYFLFSKRFLPNRKIRAKCENLKKDIFRELGKPSLINYLKGLFIHILFLIEITLRKLNIKGHNEPETKITFYNMRNS